VACAARDLSGEIRGNRDRQPIPQRMQPGAQNPVGQPPVVGGKFARDPGLPDIGLFFLWMTFITASDGPTFSLPLGRVSQR
jgi:hypothetical protein